MNEALKNDYSFPTNKREKYFPHKKYMKFIIPNANNLLRFKVAINQWVTDPHGLV